MIEVKAPDPYQHHQGPRVFLGGSIEMDTAEPWQSHLVEAVSEYDVVLLNPRRDNWLTHIEQRARDPEFSKQVNWELDALACSDAIVFYFDPATKSPITLMELGLFAKSFQKTVLVCCPDGFWRKGNVEIVCQRYHLSLYNTFAELVSALKNTLERL